MSFFTIEFKDFKISIFRFNLTTIANNVARTNIRYGGFHLELSNVYFTHGDLDPWHPTGILEDLNESSPVVVYPYAAHVSDLGMITTSDSEEQQASKNRIRELVHQWVGHPLEVPIPATS